MCDDVVLRLKKLCKSMHVNVIKAAFSGYKFIGFLKILNFVTKMPKVFSTTTRAPDKI